MRFENRVQEVTQSTGTGDLELYGAFPKFRSFEDAFGDSGEDFPYLLETEQGDWEIGIGYYDKDENSLIRMEVKLTSEGDQEAIDVQEGIHRISHVVSAEAITHMQEEFDNMMNQLPSDIRTEINSIIDSSSSLAESTDGDFVFDDGKLNSITETYPNGEKETTFFYNDDGAIEKVEEVYDGEKKTTEFSYDTNGELTGYEVTTENV